jgi:hypothetical protein
MSEAMGHGSSASEEFLEQGFLHLRSQFSVEEVNALSDECDRLAERARAILNHCLGEGIRLADFYRQNPEELIVVPEAADPRAVCRFEYISKGSPFIADAVVASTRRTIERLMGEAVTLFKDKCNLKNPGGGAFRPHQDVSAYRHFPPKFHVTAAVPVDDSTSLNGCLELARSHRSHAGAGTELVPSRFGSFPVFDYHRGGPRNGDIIEEACAPFVWEPVAANRGDVLLFHSFVPHRSGANRSPHRRRMFFFTFTLRAEGEFYEDYYQAKRRDFDNPMFHVSTPTLHAAR